MSNPRPRITLYLDIVSPWSRVALIILKRYESVWDFELVLRVRSSSFDHGGADGLRIAHISRWRHVRRRSRAHRAR